MRSRKNTQRADRKRLSLHELAVSLVILILLSAFSLPYVAEKLGEWYYPIAYQEQVEYWADYYDVDPLAVYSIIRTESGFDPNAQSDVPAIGLMQITEETFAWIKSKIARDEEIVYQDLFDPDVNIRFGSYYLARCLERYDGSLATASAAYHSGWGTVDRLLQDPAYAADDHILVRFPYRQMNFYVYKVKLAYDYYRSVYQESGGM